MELKIFLPIIYLFISYTILYVELFIRDRDKNYLKIYLPLNLLAYYIFVYFVAALY